MSEPIVFVVPVLFVCALMGAIIARVREKSAVDGLLMGGLFGPLGLLLLMVQPDGRPVCRECGGRMVPKSRRCRHCGAERPAPPPPKPALKPLTRTGRIDPNKQRTRRR